MDGKEVVLAPCKTASGTVPRSALGDAACPQLRRLKRQSAFPTGVAPRDVPYCSPRFVWVLLSEPAPPFLYHSFLSLSAVSQALLINPSPCVTWTSFDHGEETPIARAVTRGWSCPRGIGDRSGGILSLKMSGCSRHPRGESRSPRPARRLPGDQAACPSGARRT